MATISRVSDPRRTPGASRCLLQDKDKKWAFSRTEWNSLANCVNSLHCRCICSKKQRPKGLPSVMASLHIWRIRVHWWSLSANFKLLVYRRVPVDDVACMLMPWLSCHNVASSLQTQCEGLFHLSVPFKIKEFRISAVKTESRSQSTKCSPGKCVRRKFS